MKASTVLPSVHSPYNATEELHVGDELIACLESGGRILAQFCRTGFSSLGEVVSLLSDLVGRCGGVSRLTIRNKTQGWCRVMALTRQHRNTVAQPLAVSSVAARPAVDIAGRYLIPW